MATVNPFDLLGDDDNDDPSHLIAAAQQQKIAQPKKILAPTQAPAQQAKPAKFPAKPLPPAQAVTEAKTGAGRGGGPGGRGGERGSGRGRSGGGFRDSTNNEKSFSNIKFSGNQGTSHEADTGKPTEKRGGYGEPHGSFRGGYHGGFNNEEMGDGERTRRAFERRSGTGRGNQTTKREGAGRGNWGTRNDEFAQVTEEVTNEVEKNQGAEMPSGEEGAGDVNKQSPANEAEEKEPEDKEMTLEQYQKVLEEKRKALQALKTEERKVDVDKELKSMQQLSNKKDIDDIFVKLRSEKDKRKEIAEKEDKAKKAVSINEFLKPAEGEKYNPPGGRGRGARGRDSRGGGYDGGRTISNVVAAPKIEDPGQFPTLGAK
ncbi:RGG repeats nuclear RNA binding protein A-like isoform X1 [Rhododendron vialii]|uniref:RGG repeats nuclear RNA binding protein A-like isoform X1 n=1 Tax=Rhododendron vialii TaxID=182163 RepID=UPI00265EA5E1|nr:RGG repeats nuclear RNA binding protein A-like isoform X1 [Rhododendron vialii]